MNSKKLKTEILKKLKDKALISNCQISENNFIYKEKSNSSYYVRPSYLNNLYLNEQQFEKYKKYFVLGNGKELSRKDSWGNVCKMQSLGSSSAMIVNILGRGNDDELLLIKENKYGIPKGEYYVSFERKFRTLNEHCKTSLNSPAHIDGFLLSKDMTTVILIESKMLEYLDKRENFSSQYLNPQNYYSKGEEFSKCFEKCSKLFKNLDYAQLIKHLLGFYNAVTNNSECFSCYKLNIENLENVKHVFLLNVVWCITNKSNDLYNDYEPYWNNEVPSNYEIQEMEALIGDIIKDKFESVAIKFIQFDSFSEIIQNNDRRDYLIRYYI